MNGYKEQDPVKIVEAKLLKKKFATEEEIKVIKDKIKAEIEEAVKFAEESPFPDPSELYEDNYLQSDFPFTT